MLEQHKKALDTKELLLKDEKHIQRDVNYFFTDATKLNIIEEYKKDIEEFRGHPILILRDLKTAIRVSNHAIFKKIIKKDKRLTVQFLTDIFLNDFIAKFDATKTNADKYKLYFELDKKEVHFKFHDKEFKEKYVVLNVMNYTKNSIRIVKEKKIPAIGKHINEYADFAIYLNGLPFVAIEVKTVKEGINKAFRDARMKESYHNFLFTVGTDGNKAFILANHEHSNMYLFQDYEGNGLNTGNQLMDLSMEILLDPKNLLFYADLATIPVTNQGKTTLTNARVQQYYALKAIEKEMLSLEKNESKLRAYIKHHTRTGKSFTFKLVISMTFKKYLHIFNTVFFFTPDVSSVLKSVRNEMGAYEFGTMGKIKVLKNIQDYKNRVKNKETGFFMVNMQKVYRGTDIKNDSKKVLILIDELHTNQTGLLAELRDHHFPNASYLGATATPELTDYTKDQLIDLFTSTFGYKPEKEELEEFKRENKRNLTQGVFGKELDNFPPKMAYNLGLVTKLSTYSYDWDIKLEKAACELEVYSENKIQEEMANKKDILFDEIAQEIFDNKGELSEKDKEVIAYLRDKEYKEILRESSQNKILNRFKEKVDKNSKKLKRRIKRAQKMDLQRKISSIKLDFITKEAHTLKKNLSYRPSFFWVVDDIATGLALMKEIKERNKKGNNIYNGIRFAVDVSDINLDTLDNEDKEFYHDLYGKNFSIDDINGEHIAGNNIIDDFESNKEGSVDVLILVAKKLMGYDNKQLTAVFLDREISDIKVILQVATRPTTKREGKECGYLFDLTFKREGERTTKNIQTLNNALRLYNNEDTEAIVFSNEFLSSIYEGIDLNLKNIQDFFKENGLSKNTFISHENIFSQKLISIYNKEKEIEKNLLSDYFTYLTEINNLLKQLVNPNYQFEKDEKNDLKNEIDALLDITLTLNERISNDSLIKEVNNIWYSDGDIRYISRQIFETLGLDMEKGLANITDVMRIKGRGKKEETAAYELTSIQNKVTKDLLYISQNKIIKDTNIFNYFEEIAITNSLEEIEVKYTTGQELLDIEYKKQKEDVDTNYDGNIEWYITDKILELSQFNKKISEYYSEKIKNEIDKISTEINKDVVEDIIKRMNTTSYDFIGDIFTDDEMKEKGKAFVQHWKNLDKDDKFKKVINQIVDKDKIYPFSV